MIPRLSIRCGTSIGTSPGGLGGGRYLLWSDIPNNRTRWQEETGAVSVFRQPSDNVNGNTRDRQGRLVTCEHDTRRVTRTEHDGTITVLIDKFDGKPLNSPNDVIVKSDDSICFTDPPVGILGNYEGHAAKQELPTNVYRVDARTGNATVVAGDVNRPNGLAFSPDESKMYIVEAAANPRVIKVFEVTDNGTKLANGKPFITAEPGGTPDVFRLDDDGNLWCGWSMGNARAGTKAPRRSRSLINPGSGYRAARSSGMTGVHSFHGIPPAYVR